MLVIDKTFDEVHKFISFFVQTLDNDVQKCPKPEIVAGRLTSIRNIYLRQELSIISEQIQAKYEERLPALRLVSLAAYEQVFNRQPVSSPEELRQNAVKYGLKYYKLYIDKLRMAEEKNGLCRNHGRLSCVDEECSLNKSDTSASNHEPSVKTQGDLSDPQHSETKSKYDSTGSSSTSRTSDPTSDYSSIDTNSSTTSVSSTASTNTDDASSTSTFSDTNISSSSTSTSSNESSNSLSIDSFSETTSNGSVSTKKSAPKKKLSRTKPPKIVVRRPSNNSIRSNNTKNSSKTNDGQLDTHLLSPKKQKSKKKKKK